jgi:ABC-2 type transport system permease protein
MSRLRSIWLVARREILERARSRGFVLSVAFTTLFVVGSFVVPAILFGDEEATPIGIVEPAPANLQSTIESVAATADHDITIVTFPDRAAGEAALTAETIDVLVAVPADLSSAGDVLFAKETDPFLTSLLGNAIVGLRVGEVLADSDVDQAALAQAQVPPPATAIDPDTDAESATFVFANIGTVLILVGIFSFGFAVLTGVVEEKQSRVVEVVLSTVRPRDLLMGKVLGIGILGVFQLAFFVGAAVVAAIVTGSFTLPPSTPTAVVMLVVWFTLGYTLYATTLGFLGSLASRMEEASNATTPVTLVAMASYFIALFAVVDDPSGTIATIATFLPPSAPFVVPLRAAYDAIPPWQVGVSIVLTVLAIWALFVVGGRVYSGAALSVGGRMKLRDAWRSAGE